MFVNNIIDRCNEVEAIHEKIREEFKFSRDGRSWKDNSCANLCQEIKKEYDFIQTIEPYDLMERLISSNTNYEVVNSTSY